MQNIKCLYLQNKRMYYKHNHLNNLKNKYI